MGVSICGDHANWREPPPALRANHAEHLFSRFVLSDSTFPTDRPWHNPHLTVISTDPNPHHKGVWVPGISPNDARTRVNPVDSFVGPRGVLSVDHYALSSPSTSIGRPTDERMDI